VIKILKSIPFLFIATITMGVDECSPTYTPTDTAAGPDYYDVVEVRQFGRSCVAGEPVEIEIPTDGGIVNSVVGVSVMPATEERAGYDLIDPISDWTATTDGFLIVTCPVTEPATVAFVAYVAVTL
jgi:hypothetical protein